MSHEGKEKFICCLRLCLLTLRPSLRRMLQILLRFLRRILRNTELHLVEGKDSKENRFCVSF